MYCKHCNGSVRLTDGTDYDREQGLITTENYACQTCSGEGQLRVRVMPDGSHTEIYTGCLTTDNSVEARFI